MNTTHHSAIDKAQDGLVISARAPDVIVEAIESEDYKFLVGAQWHSEYQNSDLDENLFKRSVEESTKPV